MVAERKCTVCGHPLPPRPPGSPGRPPVMHPECKTARPPKRYSQDRTGYWERRKVREGHGTALKYNAGCRCDICTYEQAEREIGVAARAGRRPKRSKAFSPVDPDPIA